MYARGVPRVILFRGPKGEKAKTDVESNAPDCLVLIGVEAAERALTVACGLCQKVPDMTLAAVTVGTVVPCQGNLSDSAAFSALRIRIVSAQNCLEDAHKTHKCMCEVEYELKHRQYLRSHLERCRHDLPAFGRRQRACDDVQQGNAAGREDTGSTLPPPAGRSEPGAPKS